MTSNTETQDAPASAVQERSIGDIIRDARNLTTEEVERVLSYQREKGVRFGEAAIALGLVSQDDVLSALAQQFHYPLAAADKRNNNPELVTLNQPFSVQAEAFRAIRSQVSMRIDPTRQPRAALAIVSPAIGDGKTFFAANLAIVMAQLGGRTLLVDADLRGPRQHEVFGLRNTSGLSTVLSGRTESNLIQQVDGVTNLFVLPGGPLPPNPSELVERPAFGLLMRELCSKFDQVVVDTPAAGYGADSAVIAARCGAALVVARKGSSKVAGLQDLVANFEGGSVQLAGAIFNEH
ncbi:polysaccharide biosynthesis tyrosine autokinase [Paucibacter sp. R3-3]|uniref:Polysaccharide biosynthesis tyrosine autokinase n=2 Tax=Roseateles agri TaxID=3098619 RepID=A0ABU5DFB9_9BURK|nr:polysaccharide biosynthesis tyrosine autokinase [Paucibacter sp. R3-3]